MEELFGDEELELPPTPSRRRFPFRSLIAVTVILLLGALWYVSAVHHDHYYLRVEGDTARIKRGYYFPVGSGSWAPNRAYEPFTLPPEIVLQTEGALSAEDLDKELYRLFISIAKRELGDVGIGDPDVAEDMLMRANKLHFTSLSEDRRLLEMLGDVAFRRGLTEVRGIQVRFDEALKQFRLAAMRGGVAYRGANRWIEAITRLRGEFRRLSMESGLDPDQIITSPPEGLFEPLTKPPEPDAGLPEMP